MVVVNVEKSAECTKWLTKAVHHISQFENVIWCDFEMPLFFLPILEPIFFNEVIFSLSWLMVVSFVETNVVLRQILIINLDICDFELRYLSLE